MQHPTQPVGCPKPPYTSRARALADDALVDVLELSWPLHLPGGGAIPVGITAKLWDEAAAIPFRQLGRVTLHDRVRDILMRGQLAFERARAYLGDDLEVAMVQGFAMDYVACLPRNALDPTYRFVRLHCGPDEDGRPAITLGTPEEISV